MTFFSMAKLMICSGFISIYIVDQVDLHDFIHPQAFV